MKLLLLKYYDNFPGGSGGERDMIQLFSKLNDYNINTKIIYLYPENAYYKNTKLIKNFYKNNIIEDKGRLRALNNLTEIEFINVDNYNNKTSMAVGDILANEISKYNPDWLGYMFFNINIAKELVNLKCKNVVAFAQDVIFDSKKEIKNEKLINFIERLPYVTACSSFVAKRLKEKWNINAVVLHPIVEPLQYICKNHKPKYIGLLDSAPYKGIHHFVNLVRAAKDKEFLLLGEPPKGLLGIVKRLSNLKNEQKRNQQDLIYKDIKILCVPSIIPEAFGRVIVEAGLNKIPSIGFDHGGIKQAMNGAGILIKYPFKGDWKQNIGKKANLDSWINCLDRLNKPDVYAEYSEKSYNAALDLIDKNQLALLKLKFFLTGSKKND